jgi:hypothetical protein
VATVARQSFGEKITGTFAKSITRCTEFDTVSGLNGAEINSFPLGEIRVKIFCIRTNFPSKTISAEGKPRANSNRLANS